MEMDAMKSRLAAALFLFFALSCSANAQLDAPLNNHLEGKPHASTTSAPNALGLQWLVDRAKIVDYVNRYMQGDEVKGSARREWEVIHLEPQWTWNGIAIDSLTHPIAIFATLGWSYSNSGAIIYLPRLASVQPGTPIFIKLMDDANSDLTAELAVSPILQEKVDGKPYVSLTKAGQWMMLASDGQQWLVLATGITQ